MRYWDNLYEQQDLLRIRRSVDYRSRQCLPVDGLRTGVGRTETVRWQGWAVTTCDKLISCPQGCALGRTCLYSSSPALPNDGNQPLLCRCKASLHQCGVNRLMQH